MLMDANDLAFEICGCADKSQRKRDILLIEKDREQARMEERAAIVAWLRSDKIVLSMDGSKEDIVANAIEAGEHLK